VNEKKKLKFFPPSEKVQVSRPESPGRREIEISYQNKLDLVAKILSLSLKLTF